MSHIAFNGLYYLLVCESSSVFVFPDFEEHWLFNLMFSHGQLEFMEFFKEMMFYPTQCNMLGGTCYLSGLLCACAQSFPSFCNPMDSSLLGSSVHGSFQARILEWVAISFSKGSSQPRDRLVSPESPTWEDRFFTTPPPGSPSASLLVILTLNT